MDEIDIDDVIGGEAPVIDIPKPTEAPKKNDYKNKYKIEEDNNLEKLDVDVDKFDPLTLDFAIYTNDDPDQETQDKMLEATKYLFDKGFNFHYSGESIKAFPIKVCKQAITKVKGFYPWKTANKKLIPVLAKPSDTAFKHGARYRNKYEEMQPIPRIFLARDIQMVLGEDNLSPISMLLLHTSDGCECVKDMDFKTVGYASFIIKFAETCGIPIFNFKNADASTRMKEYVTAITD